jgi:hypothetical protein
VENLGDEAIAIISARVPHGKFCGKENEFRPRLRIDAGKSAPIELSIACNEAPGSAVENAFLILLTEWSKARWRIFVRFLVQVGRDGTPGTTTELITTQEVGFSGVSD